MPSATMQANQLREAWEQYRQAKERLKAELREAEALSLAHGPLADHMRESSPKQSTVLKGRCGTVRMLRCDGGTY